MKRKYNIKTVTVRKTHQNGQYNFPLKFELQYKSERRILDAQITCCITN